jgi:hypothetical protein
MDFCVEIFDPILRRLNTEVFFHAQRSFTHPSGETPTESIYEVHSLKRSLLHRSYYSEKIRIGAINHLTFASAIFARLSRVE